MNNCITVAGNNFCNSHIGNGARRVEGKGRTLWHNDKGTGVMRDETRSVVISGNAFTGMSPEAVKSIGKCERIIVMGNIVHDIGRRSEDNRERQPQATGSLMSDKLENRRMSH